MKVCFLLPNTGNIPQGGYKVVYEYGNRLITDGHTVYYVYGIISRKDLKFPLSLAYKFFRLFRYIKYQFISYKPDNWFYTDKKSFHILTLSLHEKYIPKTDIVIATSWSTALWLNQYKTIVSDRKFYFIQGLEFWNGNEEIVKSTWKLSLKKIVISDWLKDYAIQLKEKADVVYNGFNQAVFYIENPINERNPNTVIMMWHISKNKCAQMGINVLVKLKKENPQINAIIFGATSRPSFLPSWMEYHSNPSPETLRHLYNSASIYMGTSANEGWGLTVGEAMLCGCAVACTNNKGYMIMAKHNQTALLSDINNEEQLYKNVKQLSENSIVRNRIAENGVKYIKYFTWDESYQKFSNILNNSI
ncbi:MAG: glycosyltransferase family 4 protein [Bacteroides sp.]|nr:glycosyltransferase family 4 protein [Bacteroides sp.]